MELTPVQRLATFVVVVLVLAGLGIYLFLPTSPGASAAGHPRPGRSSSAASHSPSASPSPSVTSTPPVTAGKVPDIYGWLPFTPTGLASAAQVTTEFADDYDTFSYRQSTSSYLAPMKPIITAELAVFIGRAYSAPGLVNMRTSSKLVSKGAGVITSLRAFGPSSITFQVSLSVRTTTTKGPQQQTSSFAVTVTGAGTNWQVSTIEPAADGNQ